MCRYCWANLALKQTSDKFQVAKIHICCQFCESFREAAQAFFSNYTFTSLFSTELQGPDFLWGLQNQNPVFSRSESGFGSVLLMMLYTYPLPSRNITAVALVYYVPSLFDFQSKTYTNFDTQRKIPKFHLISWCENNVKFRHFIQW